MTYDIQESGVETGQPVEIYRFTQGSLSWEFTSAEDTVTVNSIVYLPEAITRGRTGHGNEERKNILEVEVPVTNTFADQYRSSVPGGQRAKLVVSRYHRNDGATPEVIVIFEGFVHSVKFLRNNKVARILAAPIASATSRAIPRFTYQGLCNHVLYEPNSCKVDDTLSNFRHTGNVSAVNGNDITVDGADSFTDGWFNGGFIEFNSGADHRLVLNHVGTTITLHIQFPNDLTGQQVDLLAGCDHTLSTCDSKFFTTEAPTSNVINYGGFGFIPLLNPFENGID